MLASFIILIYYTFCSVLVLFSQERLCIFLLFFSYHGENSAYCLLLLFTSKLDDVNSIVFKPVKNQWGLENQRLLFFRKDLTFPSSCTEDSINVHYCQCLFSTWRWRLNLHLRGKLFWLQDLTRYLSYSDKWPIHFSKHFDQSHSQLI